MPRDRGFRERQIDPERAPGTNDALHPHGSAHRRYHPLGIGKTESRAFDSGVFSAKAIERREKTSNFLGAQA